MQKNRTLEKNKLQSSEYQVDPWFGLDEGQKKQLEKADILLIGDKYAERLLPHFRQSLEDFAISTKEIKSIRIETLTHQNYGLHRILHHLKELEHWPKVIVYHGQGSEYYEKTFFTHQYKPFIKNVQLLSDPQWKTFIDFFPLVSRFFLHRIKKKFLGQRIIRDQLPYTDSQKLKQREFLNHLFELELMEFIELAKEKSSKLIMVDTPIDLSIPPRKVCEASTSPAVLSLQNYIYLLFYEKKVKQGIGELQELVKMTPGNALTYFMLGKGLVLSGQFAQGRDYLEQSAAFDCMTWRGDVVLNSIIEKMAVKNDVPFLSFHDYIGQYFSEGALFEDDYFPLELFYRPFASVLTKMVFKNEH